MIRLLLSLAVAWWVCLYVWPVETLVVYAVVVACAVRQATAANEWPWATARREPGTGRR